MHIPHESSSASNEKEDSVKQVVQLRTWLVDHT